MPQVNRPDEPKQVEGPRKHGCDDTGTHPNAVSRHSLSGRNGKATIGPTCLTHPGVVQVRHWDTHREITALCPRGALGGILARAGFCVIRVVGYGVHERPCWFARRLLHQQGESINAGGFQTIPGDQRGTVHYGECTWNEEQVFGDDGIRRTSGEIRRQHNKPATSALSTTCRVFSLPAPVRGIGLAPGRRPDAPSTAFIARSPHPPNRKVLPSQRGVDRSVVPRRLHRARAGARVFAYSFNHLPRFGCAAFSSRSVPRAWSR